MQYLFNYLLKHSSTLVILSNFQTTWSAIIHIWKKYYYKYPKRTSQNFWERFKNQIEELQSKANTTRSHTNVDINIDNPFEHILFENQDLIIQTKGRILAIGRYDKNWYFDNSALYYITFDLADFQESKLTKCQYP